MFGIFIFQLSYQSHIYSISGKLLPEGLEVDGLVVGVGGRYDDIDPYPEGGAFLGGSGASRQTNFAFKTNQ